MITPEHVSEAIHDAVAPVFLLSGIGSIMGVVTNRLARAVDRFRRIKEIDVKNLTLSLHNELVTIAMRIRWMRRAIGLCTLSAFTVCLSIALMFVAVEFVANLSQAVAILFISAMVFLVMGLFCFLWEIGLATKEVLDL